MKKFWRKHWNVLPWLIIGAMNLVEGDISRWEYGMLLLAILILILAYVPVPGYKEREDGIQHKQRDNQQNS